MNNSEVIREEVDDYFEVINAAAARIPNTKMVNGSVDIMLANYFDSLAELTNAAAKMIAEELGRTRPGG